MAVRAHYMLRSIEWHFDTVDRDFLYILFLPFHG